MRIRDGARMLGLCLTERHLDAEELGWDQRRALAPGCRSRLARRPVPLSKRESHE